MVIAVVAAMIPCAVSGQSAPDPCVKYLRATDLPDLHRKIEALAGLVRTRAEAAQLIAALDAAEAVLAPGSTCAVVLRRQLPAPTKVPEPSAPAERPSPGELAAGVYLTHRSPVTSSQAEFSVSIARVADLLSDLRTEISKPAIDYNAVDSIIDAVERQSTPSAAEKNGQK
jgi:hypothetical protein